MVAQSDWDDRTTTFEYTAPPGANVTSTLITDPRGNKSMKVFGNGVLIGKIDGFGTSAESSWGYPNTLGVTRAIDPAGKSTTATYDARGRVLTMTDPLGQTSSWTYDEFNNVLTASSPNPSTTGPATITTTNTYDAGRLASVSRPLYTSPTTSVPQTTAYTRDDAAHPEDVTAITDPEGATTSFSYDATTGNLLGVTDAEGNTTTHGYDGVGRVTSTVAPNGNEPGADPAEWTTTFAYNANNQPTEVVEPVDATSTATTSSTYDLDGNLACITDPNDHTTSYDYDGAGQVVEMQRPDGTVLAGDYWPDGSLKAQLDGSGTTATSYDHDAQGRLISTTDALGNATTFGYDAAGNPVRLRRRRSADRHHLQRRHHPECHLRLRHRRAARHHDRHHRHLELLLRLPRAAEVPHRRGRRGSRLRVRPTRLAHQPHLPRPRHRLLHLGRRGPTRGRHRLGGPHLHLRPRRERQHHRHRVPHRHQHERHVRLRPRRPHDLQQHQPLRHPDRDRALRTRPGRSSHVRHPRRAARQRPDLRDDALDQLCYAAPSGTGTCDQPPTGATSFTYDAAGNLTAGPTAAIQRFNTANQLCWTSPTPATGTCNTPPTGATTYSYDTRGNRTTTTPATGDPTAYVYDQANRLTATTGAVTSSYTYDGDGLRTASTIEGATSQFTWSQAGGLPLVLNDGTNAYLYGTDGLPLAHQDTASGDVAYYHHDQLGSTRLLTATDGATIGAATYDPYGTPADSTGEVSPLGFAGQYTDPHTGLQYLRARYYDPTTGQFLTRDPLESLTGEAYGYASNDPANYSDPTGTFPWLAAIGAAVGGFVVDAGSQVVNNLMNGCEWSDVNWGRAALTGVATGATVVGLGAVANGLRGVKALQVASSATAKVHGNSAASPARAYLYRLSDAEGNYLKTGISQNPMSRYTKTFMQDKEMQILQSGNRREMLNLERFIVERDPGPLNRERWAGKYSWDVPS